MKSIFLGEIEKPELLTRALSRVLPRQESPWILFSTTGDPIAYFNIVNENESVEVQADVSGRHYYEDASVADVLRQIGVVVGGRVISEEEG